jgi:hypothetical protein
MDEPARIRLQIRFVVVAYRAELARLSHMDLSDEDRQERTESVRARSLQILDAERDKLDGGAPWHPEILQALANARSEVTDAT